MGETFHFMRVCDPRLVAELSDVASEAVRRRDAAGLHAFLERHGDRRALIDGHRVPLDAPGLARARESLAKYGKHVAAAPFIEALNALSSSPREVGKTAQSSLLNRAARVGLMLEIDAPAHVLETELAYARAALAALDTADLSARESHAGLGEELWDGELVERCLDLCVVPGEADIGLGEAWSRRMEPFIDGAPLIAMPHVSEGEEPSPELLGRVVERFGVYSTSEARELLLEDWLRFGQSFTYYVPPSWAEGAALKEAAARVRKRSLARALDRVGRAGQAVVEWVEKA